MKFNLPKNSGMLPTDQHRALKNYRLMQWAKVATFGLYIVAVFMLYVSDVWGVASFVEKNSNEYIALFVFTVISFVMAFFLASSKEAVYEDIALHRSEGWKLKGTQYAAMGLFLSSGILFEMFSTTNNQQHIANTAAEQSTMMKSIQGTDVSLLGSANLTDSFASAQMKLAQCQERLARGKESHCKGAEARVNAVRESMTMSNQLATTAAQQSVDNKVDGMLKIREHFDKPMFQAIGKATGTDNNSGMLMVIGVLIFIFECQHIMALFAYANSLARINRKSGDGGNAGSTDYIHPSPLGESAPTAAFNSARMTVGEYAQKVEQGLKASPEIIATEYARADYANKQVLADMGVIGGKIGAKIDAALYPPTLQESDSFKQSPEQKAFVIAEYQKQLEEYERAKQSTLGGENTVKYLTPKMSVEETVKHIQSSVKQSGATSPEAIQAAVFDTFAAMPNPAPLNDVILERIAEKLAEKNAEKAIPTTAPAVPFHQQSGATGIHNPALGTEEEHFPLPLQAVHVQSEQHVQATPSTVHVQSEQPRTDVQATPSGCTRTVRTARTDVQASSVHVQSEQSELTAAAKEIEADLYPQWLELVRRNELKAGARDCKRFISQSTFTTGDKTVLSIQEMQRIWASWQDRAANDGVLTANPKYQPGNRQPKYVLA